MAIRKTARRTAAAPQTTPRHLWLAALGAVAVARREALGALGTAVQEAGRVARQASRLAGDARDVARGVAITLGERVEPRAQRFSAEVEARLAPVLDKFGVPQARRKPARRPRGPARKSSARSASARKQAATRVARKGRG